jgi:hypothetical protein
MASSLTFSVVGPWYDGTSGDCLDGAQPWGVERYQDATSAGGGAYFSLTDGTCANVAIGSLLEAAADGVLGE